MDAMAFPTRPRLAALLATSVVVLAGCSTGDDPQASDPNDKPAHSGKPSTSPSPTDDPSATQSGGGTPSTVAAPLYFVGDTPRGPRLFREFQQVEADNPADEALALISAGDASDPDYRTLLPRGQLRLAGYDDLASVTVPAEAQDRPGGMSAKEVQLAVQQVVYTVQGVLQKRIPIGFVTSDGDSTTFLGVSTPSGGFTAAPQNR